MRPVAELDRAAAEIARQNYDYRVGVESGDELGRLATTFNGMCESIQHAREDLTRQERISTIGRLSTSIVHDLRRNPWRRFTQGSECWWTAIFRRRRCGVWRPIFIARRA